MADGPRIIASSDGPNGFRVVRRFHEGAKVIEHVLEVPDGCDALGVERWREFQLNSVHLKNLFSFFVKVVTAKESA